ncbi:MAG: HAMP domain-containing histidine kinase [Patescibacteria group bacterium]|nr:HAMP domain-containing histidine kinase [Patescibacteria group bacterium]
MNPQGGMLSQLNIFARSKKYNIALWQYPEFLFLMMGIIIISSALITYAIGNRYIQEPLVVALFILLLVTILFIISVIITRSFERLAEANRMKSEFISVVSHQLRSPLSNLRWIIELLMSGKLGKIEEKQTEYFKILKENNARMQELISDLLIISRLESAKLPLRKKLFSIKELTEELVSGYMPFAKASNVEINLDAEEKLLEVFSDPSQIRLVIENLLDNAIRYSRDKGKIEIRISNKNKDVLLSIKDNGVGIPQGDQKYIFQKFFRSENVMRYQTQGSGLGLYISKAIIGGAKGKIGFKSEENKGSTFWFTIPIK